MRGGSDLFVTTNRVLILEGDANLVLELAGTAKRQGFLPVTRSDDCGLRQLVLEGAIDMILVGSAVDSSWEGLEVASRVRSWDPLIPLVLLNRDSSEKRAIEAMRIGVNDYLVLPLQAGELAASIERVGSARTARGAAVSALGADQPSLAGEIIGDTESMRRVKAQVRRVAGVDSNVVITGETGTGKERVAQLLHQSGPRSRHPLVRVNCAAVPDGLLESEWFGYERGAFTGAGSAFAGRFKLADGGTLFLDEISEMSVLAQAKVLRAIESKEVESLGSRGAVSLDIRIIAATNQDLEHLVALKKFRRDLFYRLHVVRIDLPPLRERRSDIPLLLRYFLEDLNRRFQHRIDGFSDAALDVLMAYHWPGNVRELRNLVESIYVDAKATRITAVDLPPAIRDDATEHSACERDRLIAALRETSWNKSEAARKLRWSRMTVYRKMAKYRIDKAYPTDHTINSSTQD